MGLNRYQMKKLKEELAELERLKYENDPIYFLLYMSDLESKYKLPIESLIDQAGIVFADA